jgi:hypothetical protein
LRQDFTIGLILTINEASFLQFCSAVATLHSRNSAREQKRPKISFRTGSALKLHNPHDFLFKYNLVKTEDEWNQFRQTVKETSVLQRGLSFTVLSLNKDGLPHLIWLDDYRVFRAGMPSFEETLEGLELADEVVPHWKFAPSLYFGYLHGKTHGYKLALNVRKNWWEKNRTSETEKNGS